MILVTVMYPSGADATFDHDYYLKTHIPLVKERWAPKGLKDVRIVRAVATPDGSAPPFQVMALLSFGSADEFRGAAEAHGPEIFADIPRFTNVQPVVQINDVVA
jgi:uncharacterized protein (TIGR02118 family)